MQEVADAVEDEAVVEIADGAREDEPQRHHQPLLARDRSPQAPHQDRRRSDRAHDREEAVRRPLLRTAHAEERAVVDARHDRALQVWSLSKPQSQSGVSGSNCAMSSNHPGTTCRVKELGTTSFPSGDGLL